MARRLFLKFWSNVICIIECYIRVSEQHVFYTVGWYGPQHMSLGPSGLMLAQIHCYCFDVLVSAVFVASMKICLSLPYVSTVLRNIALYFEFLHPLCLYFK